MYTLLFIRKHYSVIYNKKNTFHCQLIHQFKRTSHFCLRLKKNDFDLKHTHPYTQIYLINVLFEEIIILKLQATPQQKKNPKKLYCVLLRLLSVVLLYLAVYLKLTKVL